MNILVIKQSSLGDVLHSTAALAAIKEQYPLCHLTVLTNKASSGILENNPDVDELIQFDYALVKKHWPIGLGVITREFKRAKKRVNKRRYDLAFDLQGLLRSVLFLYTANADKKYVKGRWLGLQGFRNKQLHAIDEIAQVLNLGGVAMPSKQMRLNSTDEEIKKVDLILNSMGHGGSKNKLPLIVISPFTRWESKNWPLVSFVELANKLSSQSTYQVVITGTVEDKIQIEAEIANITTPRFVSLAGELSIGELAALMDKAALVVSGDSFPMHLASAVGAPIVALFGPTDENKTGPLGQLAKVVRPKTCNKCDNSSCPRECLQTVSVSQVQATVESLLR